MEKHVILPPEIRELVSHSSYRPKTYAEHVVLQAAVSGHEADCFPPHGDPSIRTNDLRGWSSEQVVRGAFMQWILLSVLPARKGTTNRISVTNANFPDGLDLSNLTLSAVLLRFANCRFGRGPDGQGNLDVDGSHLLALELDGSWAPALSAGALVVEKDFTMVGFKCPGTIDLSGAKVDGSLNANDCTLGSKQANTTFDATNLVVSGDFLLNHSKVVGGILLHGATIGGSFDCSGVDIDGGDSYTVHLEKTTVGNISLGTSDRNKPFSSTGCVLVENSTIKNGINAAGGQFRLPPSTTVPNQDIPCGLIIAITSLQGYNFFTKGFQADGVSFRYSEFGIVDFRGARIGTLGMDLEGTKVRELKDSRTSWPSKGKLRIAGFTYDQITYASRPPNDLPDTVPTRLLWIELDPHPTSQLYNQYAQVLTSHGDDSGAKLVNETMESAVGSLGTKLLRPIKYGYAPENAIIYLLALTGLGWIIYRRNFLAGRITPTECEAYNEFKEKRVVPAYYTRFSALMYSLENTLPVVNLGQAAKWQPDPSLELAEETAASATAANDAQGTTSGHLHRSRQVLARRLTRQLRVFLWVQILVGWVLATLFLAAIGGLIRK